MSEHGNDMSQTSIPTGVFHNHITKKKTSMWSCLDVPVQFTPVDKAATHGCCPEYQQDHTSLR